MKLHYFSTIMLVICASVLLSGCASSLMHSVEPLTVQDEKLALVTFLRPSYFGGAIEFGVWDSDRLIGIVTAGNYVQYYTEPGEHIFLARAENWSYVHATLEAGKKYYILTKVFPGVWKARIAFDPICRDDPTSDEEIASWMKNLLPIGVIPEKVDAYVTPRLEQVRNAVEEYRQGNVKYEVLSPEDFRE